MSDMPVEVSTGGVEPSPAPVVDGGAGAAGAAPVPAVEPDVLAEPPADVRMFDRSYTEKIRNEAASQRVARREAEARATELEARIAALAPIAEVFDEFEPDEAQYLQGVLRAIGTEQGVEATRDLLQRMTGSSWTMAEAAAAQQAAKETAAAPEYDPYDPQSTQRFVAEQVQAQVRAELQAYEQQRQIDAQVVVMQNQLTEAGYEGNDAIAVLARAQQLGSLDKAIAEEDAAFERRYAARIANKTPTPNVLPAGQAGIEPPPERSTDWRQADKDAAEYVRNLSRSSTI